jgi:hypothetical protein
VRMRSGVELAELDGSLSAAFSVFQFVAAVLFSV